MIRSPRPPGSPARPAAVRRTHPRFVLVVAGLVVALLVAVVASIGIGSTGVGPGTTLRILAAHLLPGEHVATWTLVEDRIVWSFRTPRVLLAAVVGAALAIVGVILQAVIRNPLADPYVLGASSGAALGAVIGLVLGASVPGLLVSGSAFAGAVLAGLLVYLLASRGGRIESLRLVLAGVALSYLFSAVTSWITVTAEHGKLPGILFFLLGSISSADWATLPLPALVLGLGAAYALLRTDHLNAVMTGDETATSLGVDVTRFRIETLLVTSLLVGSVVAVAGGIGFVGMVVPHVCRLLVGADHRRLLPVAALAGALLLVAVDTLARTAAAPRELPVGVVTALVGAPFFLWLLRRRPVGGVA
ncbi:FecCD family ABC transporter permease [Nocardioides alkalitolerans]|uniref:FecCD family ABC transporter permease n=1 Tax=Nocardioides alkalitolerans TaxID=281714 RepID=UPI0003F8F7CA|nr:iron ABC transporter permease [Nocardioides alkalitolerans]